MVLLAVVVAAIMFFTLTFTAQAAQYGTNFKYDNLTQMKDDGWTLTREAGFSLPAGGGVILTGSGGVSSSIGHYNDVPLGIFDWKVEVQGAWLGGSGHSLIDAIVVTEKHTYVWAVDGSSGEFVFYRDGVEVPGTVTELFGTASYQEKANEIVQLDMERHGTIISFYFNSQLKRTYTEPDMSLSRVTGVSITSPASKCG